jgi:hypothetical protein
VYYIIITLNKYNALYIYSITKGNCPMSDVHTKNILVSIVVTGINPLLAIDVVKEHLFLKSQYTASLKLEVDVHGV